LASSGLGKNSSLGLIDTFYFADAFKYISETVYPKYKEVALSKLEDNGNDRPIHTWVKSLSNATTSGMFAYAESFTLCGIGGMNIEVDEIANAVTSKAELLEILLTPYDVGNFSPVAKRTDADSMDIAGLPVNLYCFGNKVRLFEGDNVESSFIKLLDEGYARRMIFVDDNSVPTRRTHEDILHEMEASESIKAKRNGDREFIKSLIKRDNLGKVLLLNRDAMVKYAMIRADSENYLLDNRGLDQAVKADLMERNFKTAKLAGVYAFFDESSEVLGRHMDEAFEVVQESSRVLMELRKIKPKHERLLEAMLLEDKPITSQHMLNYSFIPSAYTKKVLEYVDLAKELASERGMLWKETSTKGVSYYRVSHPTDDESKELDEINKKDLEEAEANRKNANGMSEAELLAFLND
jgi:hypothetical protein